MFGMFQASCRRNLQLHFAVYVWIWMVGMLASGQALAEDSPKSPSQPENTQRVSFLHDVVPILTREGCNSGACHGTPSGKNGFRLSLRGYDPSLDFQSLTRDMQGRRINRLEPESSLILLKASGQMPHGGGRRFDPHSLYYDLLRHWIAQGADDDSTRVSRLTKLEIIPNRQILIEPKADLQLRVQAYFGDGSVRDVTKLARFSLNDEAVAGVTPQGRVERLAKGEVAVSAEYMSQMATASVIFGNSAFTWNPVPENNAVDHYVFAKLRLLQMEPSGLAGDEEFLRRAFLDAIGKLPSPEEAKRFLADHYPHKRDKLIDALLERPEFTDWWAMKWADRLGCNQRFVGKIGAVKYHEWIRQAILCNIPEDEFVRSILTAGGGNYGHPPVGFYRRLRDPLVRAEEVAQLFLGVRLQCARCHNHPGEHWTQDDYYGLAAFFARLNYRDGPFFIQIYDKEETVYPARQGEVVQPRTGQVVPPKFLGDSIPAIPPYADRREALARWLTSPDNPLFARAAVNRLWFHLFGRGIVEPVDDFRSTNPPSNEELLSFLAAEFIRHGFDRKHLIRTIMKSRTYQLSSRTTATNAEDDKYFSHTRVRLMGAEELLDAIVSATGVAEKFPGFPLGTPAMALADGEYQHPFLEAFGRPARAMACECERGSDTTLIQALQLVGGRVVQDKIHSDGGRVSRLITSGRKNAEIVDELFLATLTRRPSPEEERDLVARLDRVATNRRQAVEDLLWALINHKEFLFQH
jgi:hypothetical protein